MLVLHVCLSARLYNYTRTSKLSFVKLGEEADNVWCRRRCSFYSERGNHVSKATFSKTIQAVCDRHHKKFQFISRVNILAVEADLVVTSIFC